MSDVAMNLVQPVNVDGPADELLEAIVAAVGVQGDWVTAIVGPGIARDPRNWRRALDAVAPNRPVILLGFWGHTTILNSTALERLGIAEDVADELEKGAMDRRVTRFEGLS